MSNFVRLLIINIVVIVILIGGGAVGYYYYDQKTNFVKTDNASISGQAISIASPVSGKLVNWKGQQGDQFNQNQTIGDVASTGTDGKPVKTAVKMPESATIALNSSIKNTFVAAGTQLAEAYNLNALYVTANIDETSIDKVKTGQKVDLSIDAFPGTKFTGKVEKIGTATAGTFSLIANSNSNGNFTKVTQVVPVKIKLDGYKGEKLLPGMNVTVKIHI
ncbi:HlyD family secretion protein [Sporolactobacillus kofuensis]|uniref:HlyD family secretion protein n=1 Tax=Sporolactobacillus kofuensis TaxID=269672 RepID=A0ABW1WD27_9BACL|nr:HlyD family efflux transporter periplasmic adaptor subunit [Sporolactobacillus kofuensis]MCO7175787.1 HlyD family efflux transporter periplasmic adaptor subunit [Sporolactobacillus kofuensis]